jgi:hypothetical protein
MDIGAADTTAITVATAPKTATNLWLIANLYFT